MNFIVKDNVNIVDEICNTLSFIVNEEDIMESLIESFNKHGMDSDIYIKKDLKNLFKFIDKFKGKNKIPIDNLRKYFKTSNRENAESIASIFIKNLTQEQLVRERKRILSMDEEKLKELVMKEILMSLDYFLQSVSRDDELENLDITKEFMPYLINNCDIKDEVKWHLTIIAQEPKVHLVEMIDMIIDSVEIFNETFKVMEKDVAKCVTMIKDELEKNPKYVAEITGMKALENWDRDIWIHPSIVNFNAVSVHISKSILFDITSHDNLFFGYKIHDLIYKFQGSDEDSEIIVSRLKCLGDKSKFTILKLLKERPMFGQEIASALSLTTATVSYHMNTLLCAKLIFIERIENKIFYTINSESIDEIIKVITKELK